MQTEQMKGGRFSDSNDPGIEPPRRGDRFHCEGCGMSLQVTVDCRCVAGEHVHFHCCGREMVKD